MRSKVLFSILVFVVSAPSAWAQAKTPVTDLGRNSDLIVIAKIDQIIDPGGNYTPEIKLQLQIATVLKGQPASQVLFAGIPARPPRISVGAWAPPEMVGQTGLWFLKQGPSGYNILPRDRLTYRAVDLFLPVDTLAPAPSGSLDEQLLTYHVRWYMSLDNPKAMIDDYMFLSSFEYWNDQSPKSSEIMIAVAPLLQSSSPSHHIVGLTAALRAGSADALTAVIDDLAALRSNPKFGDIITALAWYPRKDASWVPPLRRLIEMRTDVPGLESAAVGALSKIRSKTVLPVLAELFDRKDPQVQRGVAAYFAAYAVYATKDGEFGSGGIKGPFYTPEMKTFTPREESSVSPQQYADFWKDWWTQNSSRIMSGTPAAGASRPPGLKSNRP